MFEVVASGCMCCRHEHNQQDGYYLSVVGCVTHFVSWVGHSGTPVPCVAVDRACMHALRDGAEAQRGTVTTIQQYTIKRKNGKPHLTPFDIILDFDQHLIFESGVDPFDQLCDLFTFLVLINTFGRALVQSTSGRMSSSTVASVRLAGRPFCGAKVCAAHFSRRTAIAAPIIGLAASSLPMAPASAMVSRDVAMALHDSNYSCCGLDDVYRTCWSISEYACFDVNAGCFCGDR